MPTIFRFNGLNVLIYPADHRPAHVHVRGRGFEAAFYLNYPSGPLEVRTIGGHVLDSTIHRIAAQLEPHIAEFCSHWRKIHGDH